MEAVLAQKKHDLSKAVGNPMKAAIVTGQLAGLIMAVVVMAVFAIFFGKSPH